MAQPTVKTSFASGEWAPKLRSRVDIQKYHAGATLLRNFYVDYSGGGASTRQGTKFINQVFKSASPVRLVEFQPSATVGYVLEFGDGYIRFYNNGAAILETAFNVTSTTGNSITAAGNNFSAGDWVFIGGQYYIVLVGGSPFTVSDLFGNASVTPTGTTVARVYTLTAPYAATDLFPNPLTGNPGIKFVQDVTSLIICHPSYQPQILTIVAANNWTITTINFGATIATPTIASLVTNLSTSASAWNYAYTVTAVDVNGQESLAATPSTLTGYQNLGEINSSATVGASTTLTWNAVTGAVSYNVYKASPQFNVAIPAGAPYGFIGNTTALSFVDTSPGIGADFSQTPPVAQNPFQGSGVQSYTVTNNGTSYTTVPSVTVAAPAAGGYQATAAASLGVISMSGSGGQIVTSGANPVGSVLTYPDGVTAKVTAATFAGAGGGRYTYTGVVCTLLGAGSLTGVGSTIPSNPVNALSCSVTGFIDFNGSPPPRTFTWALTQVVPVQVGAGYTSVPAVTFSAGTGAATAVLGTNLGGNPGVPGFMQERLTLAAKVNSVQSFDMSQPGSFFNFNTTDPVEADNAISGAIISEELNAIRSLVAIPAGLLAFTSGPSWVINGGGGISTMNPITPSNVTASPQAFNGANDLRPIKINFDILYATNKGSYVRDLSYNIYANIFTGTDISVLSNHLFFDHYLVDWAWAEEPLKTVWAVREDGIMLSLAYVKEQELIGWAHHDTNGQFMSVCSVIEEVNGNTVDAVYVVVQRIVNSQTVQYVERMADRYFTYGYEDAWSVDAGLQTQPSVSPGTNLTVTGDASAVGNTVTLTDSMSALFTAPMASQNWIVRAGGGIYKITGFTSTSIVTATVQRVPSLIDEYTNIPFATGYTIWTPVTTVSGLTQLEGQTVVGVADGVAVGPLTVSATGSVTLASAATKVTLGLSYTPQLQTLPLDLGEPTVQGKRKKITALTVRVADTLGLQAGKTFSTLVTMKDFQLGAIPTTSSGVASVTDLVNGDGRTIIDQDWEMAGNYCLQQNLPYPATVLGVFPEVAVGDTPK